MVLKSTGLLMSMMIVRTDSYHEGHSGMSTVVIRRAARRPAPEIPTAWQQYLPQAA